MLLTIPGRLDNLEQIAEYIFIGGFSRCWYYVLVLAEAIQDIHPHSMTLGIRQAKNSKKFLSFKKSLNEEKVTVSNQTACSKYLTTS